jgi:phosphatidylserine/phosphatidylglycerophosphate/cardiolipin synthase-like enzyme
MVKGVQEKRRMKLIGAILILLFLFFSVRAQQSISTIKSLPPGSVVTTTGTISTGNEFGQIRYIQDDKAGIALYSSSLSSTQPGDSIIVSGVLSTYKGELQLSPVMSFQVLASGKSLAVELSNDLQFISEPSMTGRLFSISCVGIRTIETRLAEGPYSIYDQFGHVVKMNVLGDVGLIGQSIPTKAVSLSGIWTTIYDQYQLLVRNMTDAAEGSCHLIPPAEIDFLTDEVQLTWNNFQTDSTFVQWGKTDFDFQQFAGVLGPSWSFIPTGLEQGKLYQCRLMQIRHDQDTFYSPPVLFAAPVVGPPIEVCFNHQVDASFSDGSKPAGTLPSSIETQVISLIDQTHQRLDIAVYNAGSYLIIDAIKRAVQRGVQVRYITDDGTSNTVLDGITSFPILFRHGDGIMHNKFMIGDVEDLEKAFLWTGSTNWTLNQLNSDPNHAYVIRDQALAFNYELEFDEMWGAGLNHGGSRIGDAKTDNTAHEFSFNNSRIESCFSPSDEPDGHILRALSTADYQVEIGLLLLTSQTLLDEIIRLHDQGVDIRVILDDEASSADAVSSLKADGIPVAIHDPSPIFHHKYAVIDEGHPDSDPQVVTGSHNWTFSADHINDENTLIIHDQAMANIFRQEFEARWKEIFVSGVDDMGFVSHLIYPNPVHTGFQFYNPLEELCQLTLVNLDGRSVQQFTAGAGQTIQCRLMGDLPSGYYALRTDWSSHHQVTGILILSE